MIQKHQRIVFWCMVLCILAMGSWLAYERHTGRQRIQALSDNLPLDAPTAVPESVTFDLANDSDGSISATDRQIALPSETNARVRALIDHLIAEYALPGSAHPLDPGAAVNEVFLLPLPLTGYTAGAAPVASTNTNALQPKTTGGMLAVIDLRSAFVNQHPSGVEVESLTLLSILGTLHANVPVIEQVRFLVDGQPRETLAGHADLLRTYPSRDTTSAANIQRSVDQ
jgi:hypothetical protein